MNVRLRLQQGERLIYELTGRVEKKGDLDLLKKIFWETCSPPWGSSTFMVEKI
jgi:hypothetical protein